MLEVRTWEEAGKKNEEREKLTNTGPIWLLQTHTQKFQRKTQRTGSCSLLLRKTSPMGATRQHFQNKIQVNKMRNKKQNKKKRRRSLGVGRVGRKRNKRLMHCVIHKFHWLVVMKYAKRWCFLIHWMRNRPMVNFRCRPTNRETERDRISDRRNSVQRKDSTNL